MYKINFFYKMIYYLLIMGIAFVFFSEKVDKATAKPISPKTYQNLDISKTNIQSEDITAVKPSPFFSLEGMKLPSVPAIPDMKTDGTALRVMGCIPPDIVILKKNGKTLTARTGEDTYFGHVGAVYIDGAWIDNKFMSLKK